MTVFTIEVHRPHRMYYVDRCDLLLQRGLSMCVSVDTSVSCAKTAEPIEMPFRM